MSKHFSTGRKGLTAGLAALVLFSSCTSYTTITSEPPGARLYLDHEFMGETPVRYSDTKIVGSCSQLRLEMEGYENLDSWLCRNEEVDAGAVVGGIFFLFPFLWIMKYKPYHNYELRPLPGGASEPELYDFVEPEPAERKMQEEGLTPRQMARLRELKKLLDEDILTREEFEAEKKKILQGK